MKSFNLNKDIVLDDLIIYINSINTLVLGDLHLGYEENLHTEGFLIPKSHFSDMKKKITTAIKKYSPESIVLIGDIKHTFHRDPFKVSKNIKELFDYLSVNCKKLYILKGNHEKLLKSNKLNNYDLLESKKIGDYFFCHGHIFPENMNLNNVKTIIIGHVHPAIKLCDYSRKESYKCFLYGKFKKYKLLVLPSLNLITRGMDVIENLPNSPFITNMNSMNVFIVGKEILNFGKVSVIQKRLYN